MTTLGALVSKVKSMEEIRSKMRIQEDTHRSGLGKRPYGSFELKKYEADSSFGPSKRMTFERTLTASSSQSQSSVPVSKPSIGGKPTCDRCMGPHTVHDCKWKTGACFTCGQTIHQVSQCPNPVLKNAFCFHCTQRGHLYSECPERRKGNGGKPSNRGKPGIRVFSLQHDD